MHLSNYHNSVVSRFLLYFSGQEDIGFYKAAFVGVCIFLYVYCIGYRWNIDISQEVHMLPRGYDLRIETYHIRH